MCIHEKKRSLIIKDINDKYNDRTMLNRSEVASYLRVTPATIVNLEKKKLAPGHLRIGSSVRYPVSSLADYLIKNEVK